MKWLRSWFGLCDHKWTTFKEVTITLHGEPCWFVYFLRCDKCGCLKKRELM